MHITCTFFIMCNRIKTDFIPTRLLNVNSLFFVTSSLKLFLTMLSRGQLSMIHNQDNDEFMRMIFFLHTLISV